VRSDGVIGPGARQGEADRARALQLVRDPHFVGGLAIDVMGWTGPLGQGTTPYTVHHSFNGLFLPKIVIVGQNKRELIDVKEIPFTNDEDYVKHLEAAAA
jgi:hypothetical protein